MPQPPKDYVLFNDPQTEELNALNVSVNEGSIYVQKIFVTFLLFSFYVMVIVFSTTDEQLLRKSDVILPLLNIKLPIVGFFAVVPWLVVLFHLNLLLQINLLTGKLSAFAAIVELTCPLSKRQLKHLRIYPFLFSQMLVGDQHSVSIQLLMRFLVWVATMLFPFILLLSLQWKFVRYHDLWITRSHQLIVCLDLFLYYWVWHINVRRKGGIIVAMGNIRQDRPFTYFVQRISFVTVPVILGLAIVTTFNLSVIPNTFDRLRFKLVRLNLKVNHVVILEKELRSEEITHFLGKGLSVDDIRAKLGIGFDLKKRDFRNADFRNITLINGKLYGANLQDTDLDSSNLRGANLNHANLQGATLTQANLQGAKLQDANLRGANLFRVNLRGADLSDANLQCADLSAANLQGACLAGANLQGANLGGANFQGANLYGTNLQVARLWETNLQGADLSNASLQGAILRKADLRGARLINIDLSDTYVTSDTKWGLALLEKVSWKPHGNWDLMQSELDKKLPTYMGMKIDNPIKKNSEYIRSAKLPHGLANKINILYSNPTIRFSDRPPEIITSAVRYQEKWLKFIAELSCEDVNIANNQLNGFYGDIDKFFKKMTPNCQGIAEAMSEKHLYWIQYHQ